MKRIPVLILVIFFLGTDCFSQQNDFFVSGSVHLPVGDFSTTHWLGVGTSVSSVNYTCDSLKQKKISLTYTGGISYFFAGQRQKVNGFSYDYPSYFYAYGIAGILVRPYNRLNISAEAGPALSIYKKNTRFNIAGKLGAAYFIDCNLSVGPSLFMIKEPGANPLWSLGLNANFRL